MQAGRQAVVAVGARAISRRAACVALWYCDIWVNVRLRFTGLVADRGRGAVTQAAAQPLAICKQSDINTDTPYHATGE